VIDRLLPTSPPVSFSALPSACVVHAGHANHRNSEHDAQQQMTTMMMPPRLAKLQAMLLLAKRE